MDPLQAALARHHSYTLLGRLYLEGLTTTLLPYLQAIPQLSALLPASFDADEAAARHYRLFGFNVFPYESIFLDGDGLLGGPLAAAVQDSYRRCGYNPHTTDSSPDHVGHEVGLLAFLCAAEADAWQDDLPSQAERMRRLQRDFLQQHLLRWLPPLLLAIRQQEQPFYTALANLTLDLLHEHGAAISLSPEGSDLPAPPDLLADEDTGLKDIARYLATPPYSGIYLSRDGVGALARQLDLPRGFGSRQDLLLNLLRSAVQYGSLPALLSTLQTRLAAWQDGYHDAFHPPLASFAQTWHRRSQHTAHLLQAIQAQAKNIQ